MKIYGLSDALRQVFHTLNTREIAAPWKLPSGETWKLHILPHGDPEFAGLLKARGVHPKTWDERERLRALEKAQKTKERSDKAQGYEEIQTVLQEAIEGLNAPPESIRKFWDERYPYYERNELEQIRDLVPQLVQRMEQVDADGTVQATFETEEVKALFVSEEILPPTLTGTDKVAYAGWPEGLAWTAVVLIEALKEHAFRELLDPLGESSSTSASGGATTSE